MFHEAMSPIARHRRQQEKAALSSGSGNISTHPYLQRVNSRQSSLPAASVEAAPINNDSNNTADRIHEMKTPRARGSPGFKQGNSNTMTRREQLVSKVRASPRNSSFPPQNPASPRNKKPLSHVNKANSFQKGAASKEWQDRNRNDVMKERNISESSSGDKSPILNHFDGRGKSPTKPKGKVAQSVERANMKKKKRPQVQDRWLSARNEDQGNSLATRDCIRID